MSSVTDRKSNKMQLGHSTAYYAQTTNLTRALQRNFPMNINHDLRQLSLIDWLENDLLLTIEQFEPASSDASFRRYFRVTTPDGCFIVMDAPPERESTGAFIRVAQWMAQAALRVPTIYHQNQDEGFLLLEDFGSQSYLDVLNTQNADDLYQRAFDTLFLLQSPAVLQAVELPCYDAALLTRELEIFKEWFIGELLDCEMPEALWANTQAVLIQSALEQPVCCVHRDYHSRNLMVLDNHQVGVLDFQDAVSGPITYDVVSLLRDCYIAWPDERIDAWCQLYFERLIAAGRVSCSFAQFKRGFDLMGMQRHLKAIGIFSRLHLRDGKPNYLQDIPRTLHYVLNVCMHHPELAEFVPFLRDQVIPAYGAY